MKLNFKGKNKLFNYNPEIFQSLISLFKSRYLYIGILALIAGIGLNFASEIYLHNYMSEGKTLPMLSDLILDNLPFYNVSLIYDIFCLVPIALFLIYIIHRKDYNRIPFILLLFGLFYIVRGVFIVLTPFGNPQGSVDQMLYSKDSQNMNLVFIRRGMQEMYFYCFYL